MGDCSVVHADRLVKANGAEIMDGKNPEMVGSSSAIAVDEKKVLEEEEEEEGDEEVPLIGRAECRICQEEDSLDKLESPCACSGSLKLLSFIHLHPQKFFPAYNSIFFTYSHFNCIDGSTSSLHCFHFTIHTHTEHAFNTGAMRRGILLVRFAISNTSLVTLFLLDLWLRRQLLILEAERQLLEAEYDDYNSANASGAAFCRSAALILMALLLLRHALPMTDTDGDDEDPTAFFSLFLLRAVGFLLPCYIMLWAISILQQRRQREEAAALAATQFAVVLHSGQPRSVQFTIASAAPATPAAPASVDNV
ncbi:hypothetical protein RDI58_012631 [Solanum bulbocastanum]|uniref:RING-CH-type domain-containing protein n=1 Tax=Solanum bulbocastanum TaxID=147425 RepID=A0AAN8YGX8_SOLBU